MLEFIIIEVMSGSFDKFSQFTTIVADTADIKMIEKYRPQDATTNPSLILKNAENINSSLTSSESGRRLIAEAMVSDGDIFYIETVVQLGIKILDIIPGRISTEVPSRYSFDTEKTVALARHIISRYQENEIGTERILIKIASTWEGIQAAQILEREGIRCNMTLLFSLTQAIACAEAGVTLISPFVGRVCDWYKNHGKLLDPDPGVKLVRDIYNYYKKFDYSVEIMGASFRTLDQVIALAGCDFLTISPTLLGELENFSGEIVPHLSPEKSKTDEDVIAKNQSLDQKAFMWELCSDPMATEKLAEGIRLFHRDFLKFNELFN